MYSSEGQLRPVPPFDFGQSLRFLGNFPMLREASTISGLSLLNAYEIGGQVVACRLVSEGTVEEPRLGYTLYSEQPIGEELKLKAEDRVAAFLSLYDDLKPFYAIGENDPFFANVIEKLYGYHQVRFTTLFEAGCWAMMSQRNQMGSAIKMKERFQERYGGKIEIDGTTYTAFPEPGRIATLPPNELEEMLPSFRRGEYIRAVAEAFAIVDEQWLRTAPYDEVVRWLSKIKGVGAWSSSFLMLRGLGRTERVPAIEGHMHDAMLRVYGPGVDMTETARAFGPYQGYWAHYLRVAS